MFSNADAGAKIIRGWRKSVGNEDKDDWIGITVITGIDRDHPAHYRVGISVGEKFLQKRTALSTRFAMVSRMKDMEPSSTANIERFLTRYQQFRRFRLITANAQGQMIRLPGEDIYIDKDHLRVTPAWQIGPENSICMMLGGVVQPIIPDHVADAPIVATMKILAERRKGI